MSKVGLGFALLTAFLWGITPIFEKLGLSKVNPLLAVTVRSMTITTILLTVMVFSGRAKQILNIDKTSLLYLMMGGISAGLLAMWTYFNALKYNPSTLVVPIAASYPLVAMIMSIIFLGEAFTVSKGFGTLLVVIGIVLLQR